MHVRKLVKSGHTSLVVAVPKEWVDRNALKQGDVVYMVDDGDLLKVTPQIKKDISKKDTKVINTDGLDFIFVKHEITLAYINNYSYIIIKGKNFHSMLKDVKRQVASLVALEVVEETSERIVAKNFLNMEDIEIPTLVRRVDQILRSMFEDMRKVPKSGEYAQTIYERDEEVNRLVLAAFKVMKNAFKDRQILEATKLTLDGIVPNWQLFWTMEKIGDRIKRVSKLIDTLPPKWRMSQSLGALLQEMESFFQDGMNAVYKSDAQLADRVSRKRIRIQEHIDAFLAETNNPLCSQIAVHLYTMMININDICKGMRFFSGS
ncbi:MAG: phosphate uptake regulator PhoU [Nanoarchaeota archaeon]